MLTRRQLLQKASSASALAALSALLPDWTRSAWAASGTTLPSLSGPTFDLTIAAQRFSVDGRQGDAITINGSIPAPILRWREGETVTLRVTNRLEQDTSIHWHGILVPPQMDGVPGVSFPGIKPGETFTYQFPVRQAGTYWYHSHSGLQEQLGHYGPLVIDPAGPDPVAFDREYVVVLSDWTFANPHRVFSKLKKMSDAYNFQRRTVGDFFREASDGGLRSAIKSRAMWAAMRMSPTDIADVTGATYTYLVNGHGPDDNWTALFSPGERVRLRFINASAMTLFNVRIPGLPLTVVQCDGLNVQPVEVDEFQMGVAETYDVIVQPTEDRAFTLVCESIDRSGMARATLAPRPGMTAEVPPLRERPLLTMKDMGMAGHDGHGGHQMTPAASEAAGGSSAMDHESMDHGAMDQGGMDHGAMDHGAMDHGGMEGESDSGSMDHGSMGQDVPPETAQHAEMGHMAASPEDAMSPGPEAMTEHAHPGGPGVDNTAMEPTNRLAEPGAGLEDVPHRVLVYADLRSLEPNPDTRAPERELELHLTGNMERYMWSFDGKKFSEVVDPIVFHEHERLRLTMVNDTMMPHPIHLHGMFFDVVNGHQNHKPRKHTIVVKPGEKLAIDITADAVGDWAFHCHLLYHMHAGMFRVVSVRSRAQGIGS